jgi:hypothetical protein
MMRRITRRKLVAAVLASGLLATTPAFGKPVDRVDRFDSPTSSLSGLTTPSQDLRGEHARDAARLAETGVKPPVYWSYGYEAARPNPHAARVADAVTPDDGTPWALIAAGLADFGLFGGAVYVTGRAPRTKVA